jgi:hypothetical protein
MIPASLVITLFLLGYILVKPVKYQRKMQYQWKTKKEEHGLPRELETLRTCQNWKNLQKPLDKPFILTMRLTLKMALNPKPESESEQESESESESD